MTQCVSFIIRLILALDLIRKMAGWVTLIHRVAYAYSYRFVKISRDVTHFVQFFADLGVFLNLVICFVGLQVSYLTWGVLQEKIMTRKYEDSAGNVGLFKDSQFLVFVNRVLAFAVALLYITVSRQPRHRAPVRDHS